MADPTPPSANDQYERFFAEKLWDLIPGVYKSEDGLAERPGTLRAFIELIAEQAALLRRSHDQLWNDAFIDLCDDWAVPYIGDLVATRMVSALNRRGRRVDVAKTIYYRRRKGTPRVLEELIADITGWDGKVVESFRFLMRCQHRLDPPLSERVDLSPGPSPGLSPGWADLRLPRLAETAGGPWDPFAHTADVRKSRGDNGRWNIPKVTFHLFRLASIALRGVTPHARADGATFTFDPSGRELQLFMPRHRGEQSSWDNWRSARPWEVPAPMACRTLGDAAYVVTADVVAKLRTAGVSAGAAGELGPIVGERFASEAALNTWLASIVDPGHRAELRAPSTYDRLRKLALVADCGKAALWPDGVAVEPTGGLPVALERVAAASLVDWSLTDPDRDLLVDPVRGRLAFTAPATPADPTGVRVDYAYGLGGGIGAGGVDRRGALIATPELTIPTPPAAGALIVDAASFPKDATGALRGTVELPDSATYTVKGSVTNVAALTVQAANFERPYVTLEADWIFTAAAGGGATLMIDGLWLGVPASVSATPAPALVLRGAWQRVELRHVTLDPGGTDVDTASLPAVAVWVEGAVDELVIDHAIAATIGVRAGGELDQLTVSDSILDAQTSGGIAVALTPGSAVLRRTTVIGALEVDHLDASDTLCTGLVQVTDTQGGCFRFSAAPSGSRLPHPYRWVRWDGGAVFASVRFGDAGYAWLADQAPDAIRRGGEDGVEIGAWSTALAAIKEDGLLTKVEEYLPFGLMPMFIHET